MPRRLGVRRIALVKHGEGHRKRRIAQVLIELRELPWRKQALINDGLGGERTKITALRQQRLRALSQQPKTLLEFPGSLRRVQRLGKELPDLWHGFERL